MKKINQFINREEKRIVSFLLAMLFILTAILASGFLMHIIAYAEDNDTTNGAQIIIRDDALHFIFRHWHTSWDDEATVQGSADDQWDEISQRYFVVVEGYIIPHNESEMSNKVAENKYTIVLVDQKTGELVQASTLYDDYVTETDENGDKKWNKTPNPETGEEEIILKQSSTPYLGEMNKTTGSIQLKVKKLADVYWNGDEEVRHDTEKFCGISLSAGRGASTLQKNDGGDEYDTILVEYSTTTPRHLVKGHIFYSSWTKTVSGTIDDKLISSNGEIDTAEVYTWGKLGTIDKDVNGTTSDFTHQAGSIVEYVKEGDKFKFVNDGSGTYLTPDDENLEDILKQFSIHIVSSADDANSNDIVLTTFYSTTEGLHTNKTLAMSADGRYFLFDLEAWYIDGFAAQLGYVIDASGSMAGTSDTPSILNIYVAIANRLGILFDEHTGYYSYSHYDAAVKDSPYHTHEFKTISLPYYEVRDLSTGETTIIRETKLTRYSKDGDEIKNVDADVQVKPGEVEYVEFVERYEKLEEIQNNSDLEILSTYYVPTDAERRDDMHKFLVTGGKFTKSIKYQGYCWSGLANEFGITELCETISNTIGDHYRFTESDWNTIASLKGAANTIGTSATNYFYPQRANLIGYYEIMSSSISSDKTTYWRTWYFNSIDVDTNSAGIRPYITPTASEAFYNSHNDAKYFALAAYPQAKTTANGGAFNFNENTKAIKNILDFQQFSTSFTGWGAVPANFSSTEGFNLAGGPTNYTDSGFMLSDASTPKTGKFTISFDVVMSNWGTHDAEILYIGSYNGTVDNADFRLVRENTDIVLYHGGTRVVLVSNYTATARRTFTFTYDKTTQTVVFYIDGNSQKVVKGVTIDNVDCIVFDPFEDKDALVSGTNQFYVDDILVYDTELTMTEVSQLVNAHNSDQTNKKSTVDNYSNKVTWDDVFLSEGLLNLFMNPNYTAHVPLGVAAYNYFVYNGGEFYPLAYWEGGTDNTFTVPNNSGGTARIAKTGSDDVLGELRNYSSAKDGWYYLSHRSDNNILMNDKVGTSKALTAMAGGQKPTDDVALNSEYVVYDKDKNVGTDKFNTGKEYSTVLGDTIPFYIDGDGNLRCFYSSGANATCSYVYELDDRDYVKSETLQRILAYFSAVLSEKTPSSQISAVQFSNKDRDLNKLVLLDWSSNPDDIAGILSQQYGSGTALGNQKSAAGVDQYNYALTGGTYTNTGLHSFLQNLVLKDVTVTYNDNNTLTYTSGGKTISLSEIIAGGTQYRRDDLDAPKFVIIFTDGADDPYSSGKIGKNNPSYPYAEALKELNYTVIGMYIPATLDDKNDDGSLNDEKGTTYHDAIQFFSDIVTDGYVFASTNLLDVANIIDTKIIESISGIMSGYTVKESIDPRFDLQTFDGTVWHLNGDGSVTIESAAIKDSEGKYSTVTLYFSDGKSQTYTADGGSYTLNWKLNTELGVIFHLAGENTDGGARNPYLRYDKDNDMYYLEWENQTIRSSPVGTDTMLPVWSAEFWLVAKEDFLGGDAVLTSGNGANMNYVYHPADVSEAAYATYVFDSWAALSSSLRSEYERRWEGLTDDEKETYQINWKHLTVAEQQAMADVWNTKYKTDYSRDDFTQGVHDSVNDVDVSGARIMYMIAQMNLKRTNEYDASSGTADSAKTHSDKMDLDKPEDTVEAADGTRVAKIDELPSKGFARIAVNVLPNSVEDVNLVSNVYLGELMSPVLVLNNMVNNNFDNTYLNYLARYAYYLYPTETTPLLKLLEQWENIEAVDGVKSFSVPYMYLPNYQYDANGQITGSQLNNVGVKGKHSEDLLGLLTFHWKLIEGDTEVDSAIVNDTNMDAWASKKYSLTVEYTVFRQGDDYDKITSECTEVTIFDATLIGKDGDWEKLQYDRTQSLKDLVTEDAYAPKVWTAGTNNATDEADTGSVGNETIKSNKEVIKASITMAALSKYLDLDEDELAGLVSDGKDNFFNEGRTQQIKFSYKPEVVGADLALELKIYGNQLKNWNGDKTIEIEVQREFTDNIYAEKLKSNNSFDDYGNTFTIRYDVPSLDLSALEDDTQYTIYAKASVSGTFGEDEDIGLSALPIGDYSLTTSSVTKKGNFDLDSLNAVTDAGKYKSDYFSERLGSLFDADDNLEYAGNIAKVANSDGSTVISFGTTNNIRDYDSVICMIDITTAPTIITDAMIVIVERGGESNESFLYRITNTVTNESIIVSVKGGGQTVIIVSFGTYEVVEISEWSWRYGDGVATGSETVWTIDAGNKATTTINSDGTRTVTYTHTSNDKPWLGGESSQKA